MQFEITVPALSAGPASLKGARVGWPYLQLSPRFTCSSIPLLSCIWGSLLAGWWSFCIFVGGETPPLSEGIVLIACVAAVFRAALYCSGVAAPFNLLGRIALGRILIPGFDKVFLTPLAVAILAVLGGVIIRHAGSWFHLAESGVITVLVLVLFGGGPTLRGWILTGQHRFRPLAKTGSNARLLKPV